MTNPLISICLITYNHAEYIEEAISGVLMQKVNFSWKLIIADDFSTDGTREILLEYKKKYPDLISLILQERNVGSLQNYMRLITAPLSKYIAYLEGDDYWIDPLKLQKQIDFLENNSKFGLSHTESDYYYQHSKMIERHAKKKYSKTHLFNSTTDNLFEWILLGYYGITTSSVVFRKELLDTVIGSDPYAFKSGYFKMGDTQLWLEFALRSQIHYLQESMVVYRHHTNSATHCTSPLSRMRFSLSSAELRKYYSNKCAVSPNVMATINKRYNRVLLQYKLLDRDFEEIFPIEHMDMIDKFYNKFAKFIFLSRLYNKWVFFRHRLIINTRSWKALYPLLYLHRKLLKIKNMGI